MSSCQYIFKYLIQIKSVLYKYRGRVYKLVDMTLIRLQGNQASWHFQTQYRKLKSRTGAHQRAGTFLSHMRMSDLNSSAPLDWNIYWHFPSKPFKTKTKLNKKKQKPKSKPGQTKTATMHSKTWTFFQHVKPRSRLSLAGLGLFNIYFFLEIFWHNLSI